jgi:deazaflavin-dependent oxidoreductase (nitroreductase family)
MNRALRSVLHAPVYLYRWRCSWILGHRFLLLIHTGRRTGKRRETVLEVMQYRSTGPEAVVMSGFGHGAGWLRNIVATADAEIVLGSRRFSATCRFLDATEAVGVVAAYERQHLFMAPVIRLVLSSLLGWRYDGSPEARSRLAAQLPLIAFRPR